MGIRERYEHGVFNWVDLVTTDPVSAKQFYSMLFDWEFQDLPTPDGTPYSMAFKSGRSVAALFQMPSTMQQLEIPPHWQSYINVQDLDAATQAWEHHGGTIMTPPFEVMEAGRMAVVKDPTDAVVNLWQAKNHIGASVVNEVNTFCWTELQTRDAEKAAQFYQAVFDWEIEVEEKPPYYVTGKVQGHYNCGMFDMDKANLPAHIPSQWSVYFNVADLDASLNLAKELGSTIIVEPIVIDVGRFATIADPQGAILTLIELQVVDD
jgi:predicted enzyme related to lactoylglutathione lyase